MSKIILKESDISQGNLILVNKNFPIRFQIEKKEIVKCGQKEDAWLTKVMKARITSMIRQIGRIGDILIVSGYRTHQEQQQIWDECLRDHGAEFTQKYVAVPGCSEHQTGLAVDLGINREEVDFIRPDFPKKGFCNDFRRFAFENGFIERYPKKKESVTGISYEPWHFRYVGVPHAAIMREENMVLEEYINFIRQFPYQEKHYAFGGHQGYFTKISFIEYKGKDIVIDIKNHAPFLISGNNVDGWIYTTWDR